MDRSLNKASGPERPGYHRLNHWHARIRRLLLAAVLAAIPATQANANPFKKERAKWRELGIDPCHLLQDISLDLKLEQDADGVRIYPSRKGPNKWDVMNRYNCHEKQPEIPEAPSPKRRFPTAPPAPPGPANDNFETANKDDKPTRIT